MVFKFAAGHCNDHTAKCASHAPLPISQNDTHTNTTTHTQTHTHTHTQRVYPTGVIVINHSWWEGECYFKVVYILKQFGPQGHC